MDLVVIFVSVLSQGTRSLWVLLGFASVDQLGLLVFC